jgi:hypothetical protein
MTRKNIIRLMNESLNDSLNDRSLHIDRELLRILGQMECPAVIIFQAEEYINSHPECAHPDIISTLLGLYDEIRHTLFKELFRNTGMTVKNWFKSSEVIKGYYGREWIADTLSSIDNGLTFWEIGNRIKHNRALAGDTVTETWIRFAHRFV